MKLRTTRIILVCAAALSLTAIGATQLKEVIKILGVTAAVKQFGPEMNRAMNKLVKHSDTDDSYTKVVPIITIGIRSRGGIGAAQVKGTKENVMKVQAVAAPETQLFGREIMIRGLIPVNSIKIENLGDIKPVEGVGVSGIVDLKL